MGEIFIFIFHQIGWAALVLIIGFAADSISTPAAKQYAVDLIRQRTSAPSVSGQRNFFLTLLNGFIDPVFGTRPLSLAFFTRSCIATAAFMVCAFLLQVVIYGRDALAQLAPISYSASAGVLFILVIILFTLVADYLSNAKSISLLRMAATSGKPSNVFLIAIADTTLTIYIFVSYFPIAVGAATYLTEPLRPPAEIRIQFVQQALGALSDQETKNRFPQFKGLSTHTVFLSPATEKTEAFSWSRPLVTIIGPPDQNASAALNGYVSMLRERPNVKVLSLSETSATVEVTFKQLQASTLAPIFLAIHHETDVNRVQEVGLYVWLLNPFVVPLSHIFNIADRVYMRPQILHAVCEDGQNEQLALSKSKAALPSCPRATIVLSNATGLEWPFRTVSATTDGAPVSIFFFASFALSNLYYFIMFLFIFGVFMLRLIGRGFTTPYLDFQSKPFTILSILVAPFFMLLGGLLRLV